MIRNASGMMIVGKRASTDLSCDYYLTPTISYDSSNDSYILTYDNESDQNWVYIDNGDVYLVFFMSPTYNLVTSGDEFTLYLADVDEVIYGNQISMHSWLPAVIVVEEFYSYCAEHVGETVSIGVILGSGGTPNL